MIMKVVKWTAIAALGLGVSACGNKDAAHLIFGQEHVVGIDVSAGAADQGGTFSLGYRDKNIAIVPVAIKQNDGSYMPLGGDMPGNNASTSIGKDAYSTIGQFEIATDGNGNSVTPKVSLGKFFATGVAAQFLADGFKEKLKKAD
jgi:hypothetical protein